MQTSNYQKHINQNPIQQVLINNFYKSFFGVLKPLKPKKILDVGCGEGITLKKLEERKIGEKNEGIDNLDEAIKIAAKIYPTLNIKKGDIYNMEYKDNSFDVVLCTEVLEHLDDPERAMKELIRVSSKYLILSVPNEPFFILANFARGKYLKRFGNHPEHINHWTFKGFELFAKKHGLKVVKARHPFAWTMLLLQK